MEIYLKHETITVSRPYQGETEESRIRIFTNPNLRDGLLGYVPEGTSQKAIERQATIWAKENAWIEAKAKQLTAKRAGSARNIINGI